MTQAGDDGVELAPAPAVGGDAERLRRQQRGVVRIAQQDDGQSASPGTDATVHFLYDGHLYGAEGEEHAATGGAAPGGGGAERGARWAGSVWQTRSRS